MSFPNRGTPNPQQGGGCQSQAGDSPSAAWSYQPMAVEYQHQTPPAPGSGYVPQQPSYPAQQPVHPSQQLFYLAQPQMANPTPVASKFRVLSVNVQGITQKKEAELAEHCSGEQWQVLCVQETHRVQNSLWPEFPGMKLVAARPHENYGSAIFVKSHIPIQSAYVLDDNDIEVLTVNLQGLDISITSIYKPPGKEFQLPPNVGSQFPNKIYIGDFNCHSTRWGYAETDKNGERLGKWMQSNNLQLIHHPNLPPSFVSAHPGCARGYNPDLIFVSSNLAPISTKTVSLKPFPRSQHRSIGLLLNPVYWQ